MHTKMKLKFFNFNEYNPQKRARGFKQRNKCKIQCKKHKPLFEYKGNIIQIECRMHSIPLKIQEKNNP